MAAPFGKAEIEVEGKPYTLVFNFAAMAAIERHKPYGEPFQAIAAEMNAPEGVRMSTFALLLWGLLRAKHPHVSYDAAGEMLFDDGAGSVQAGIIACMEDAFPKDAPANPPKRAKAGTGTTS